MVTGKCIHISCAANFLQGRKCIFCGSFNVRKTARGYAKCGRCGKVKSLARMRHPGRAQRESYHDERQGDLFPSIQDIILTCVRRSVASPFSPRHQEERMQETWSRLVGQNFRLDK